jgi:uncharacterized protein
MSVYVLYHQECADGFGAAYAAWKKFSDQAEYVPVKYGEEPPEMPEGIDVYIVDFSYPRGVLEDMAHRQRSLVVLDHHKSAESELEGLDFARFDMEKSGAVMAWECFHPEVPVPDLLLYVEDRDLWRLALPDSRKINAAISSFAHEFITWDNLRMSGVLNLVKEGEAILRAQALLVARSCRDARIVEIAGYEVPAVNATCHQSEIGHRLLKLYPERPFSASYRDDAEGVRVWSLRSRGDFDVSEVARSLGGGGHKAAAGFREGSEG